MILMDKKYTLKGKPHTVLTVTMPPTYSRGACRMNKPTKTVTILRQLFNSNRQQVCENKTETCPYYTFQYEKPGCDYCDRGIIDKNRTGFVRQSTKAQND